MPATTNILQWNPEQANQETDAAYAVDAARTGGAVVNTPFSSAVGNKLLYQLSTWITAQADALVAKGFTTSDANLAVLTSVMANYLTTADIKNPLLSVAYSASPAFDASTATGWAMTLNGNMAFSISGMAVGQILNFAWKQDSIGGRTVTYPSGQFYASTSNPQPDPTPNAVSILSFMVWTDGIARPYTAQSVSAA